MDETVLKFIPDRFRLFALNMLMMAVGVMFIGIPLILLLESMLGMKIDLGRVLLEQMAFLVGWAFGQFFITARSLDQLAIMASNEYIAGPSTGWGKPINFSIDTLDKPRSSRQTIVRRVFGGRHLISTDGKKILFLERAFDKNQVEQIYQALGFAAASGTQHS